MSIPVRTKAYKDPIQHERRKRVWVRRSLWISVWCVGAAACVWLFLFSSVFAMTHVTITGASEEVAGQVRTLMSQRIATHWLSIIPTGRNMILAHVASFEALLSAQVPIAQEVTVKKQYPHDLIVHITEREPHGVWCRGEACQYWDRSGARWGSISSSVGPLLLLVQDDRSEDDHNQRLIDGMLAAVDGLPKVGIRARSVTLPDAEPGGIRITTDQQYAILADALGNVPDQLDTLSVFLADRAKQSDFKPQYLDLRTPGRVYYK